MYRFRHLKQFSFKIINICNKVSKASLTAPKDLHNASIDFILYTQRALNGRINRYERSLQKSQCPEFALLLDFPTTKCALICISRELCCKLFFSKIGAVTAVSISLDFKLNVYTHYM